MKKGLSQKVLAFFISVGLVACLAGYSFAADPEIYSAREQFDLLKNAGPVWFYELYKPEAKEYVKLDSYNESWSMWVSKATGYEWGGVGAGSWLPYWNADAVTTFVVPKAGDAVITADPQTDNAGNGMGNVFVWNGGKARIKIMKNGEKLWPEDKEWFDLQAGANTMPEIKTSVEQGDMLHFHVNAGEDMDISGDNMNWWLRVALSEKKAQEVPAADEKETPEAEQDSTKTEAPVAEEKETETVAQDTEKPEAAAVTQESTPAAVEEKEKPVEENPKTGDFGVVSIIIFIAVSGAGAVMLKRSKIS